MKTIKKARPNRQTDKKVKHFEDTLQMQAQTISVHLKKSNLSEVGREAANHG